jgi:hypothetical protein
MRQLVFFFGILVLCGCSPSSSQDFQKEGESLCRKLVVALQKVENTEDLQVMIPFFKKQFQALVTLIIQQRQFQDKFPEDEALEIPIANAGVNELLVIELQRIYQIEKGREIIEKAQKDALNRLDAFEKERKKRQERLL